MVSKELPRLQRCLAAVHEAALLFHSEYTTMPALISDRFSLQLADAKAWYSNVRISADRFLSEAALSHAIEALISAGILQPETKIDPSSLIDDRLGELHADIKSMTLYKRPELASLHVHVYAIHIYLHYWLLFHSWRLNPSIAQVFFP